ncbi:MAG: hypothetical protein DK306_000664 [Chloroflexi bacterium]|jgi:hypothetical protein|nr:MAG: hypothetical protein DK306_000664 [Chloroflexota bacterium]
MSRYLSAALTSEASGWISEQLLEEGALVPAALVESILDHEWRALQAGTDPDDRAALIAAVSASLAAQDVRIQAPPAPGVEAMPAAPQAVPESLIDRVLGWEDDFLGLAGVRRSAPDA